jgi:formiminotetrahydrofolate cyclodeaminase
MRKIEASIEIVVDSIDQWQKCNLLLQKNCDDVIRELELRRRNINIATVTGSGAGILGTALTAVGIAFAPITAGASLSLSIGGGALAATGGTVAAGAKLTETIMNKKTVESLKRYQDVYQERFEDVQCNLRILAEEISRLGDITSNMKTNQEIQAFEFASLQSLPGILRMAKGLTMIPLAVLRISTRGITILGAIIGPLSALIDAGLMAFSIRNMVKGNKTDVTENLRRISASLYGSRRQMHAWAFGNQKILFHD